MVQKFVLIWNGEDEAPDAWDWFVDDLTSLMEEVTLRSLHREYWHVEMTGFGWRSLSGKKDIKAKNGMQLLQQVLPNTDCYFKIFRERNVLKIQNFHHDSPMGNEWYIIKPMTNKEVHAYLGYDDGMRQPRRKPKRELFARAKGILETI